MGWGSCISMTSPSTVTLTYIHMCIYIIFLASNDKSMLIACFGGCFSALHRPPPKKQKREARTQERTDYSVEILCALHSLIGLGDRCAIAHICPYITICLGTCLIRPIKEAAEWSPSRCSFVQATT